MFGTNDYVWYFIGVSEGAMISSDCDDIPTEAETRSQCRRGRAVVTRRLVPLAGGSSVPLGGSSHERSRELLEEAFDIGMYHIRCTFLVFQYCSSFLVLRDFRPFRERSFGDTDPCNRASTCDFVPVSLRRGKGRNSGADHEQ